MNCPHTWFSTEFHSKPRLIKARLRDLFAAPRRRGTLPALLTLLCVVSLGSMVACGPAAPTTQAPPPSSFDAVELETPWQQDLGAGVPLPLAPEERADFALVGLGNYYDAPLEHFTLVREGDAWKLEDYGEPVVSLTADTLTGGLWLHTMLLWDALDLDAALSEARVDRVNRYTDQEGEAGDRFQIYRFYPAYTLSQDPGDALPDALTTDGLTCRPSAAPYLVFLEREGSRVCLGRLPGDAGTPGSDLFTAHRNLLLAQWEAGLSQT